MPADPLQQPLPRRPLPLARLRLLILDAAAVRPSLHVVGVRMGLYYLHGRTDLTPTF
ncbi:hypothetical protein [Streptomyces sp. NPDC020489]|uniref:hypothetical protein n=1 Tax=Streptomyces sp. NPDC020489 TaxID=3365077 RepID=UPI00378DEC6B